MEDDCFLGVAYVDEQNQKQGPFEAKRVLEWYKDGYFRDDNIQIQISCNRDPLVDLRMTIGELRERFGAEEPIPTSIEQVRPPGTSKKPPIMRVPSFELKNQPTVAALKKLDRETASPQPPSNWMIGTDRSGSSSTKEDKAAHSPSRNTDRLSRKTGRDESSCPSASSSPVSKKQKSSNVRVPFFPKHHANRQSTHLRMPVVLELGRILCEEYEALKRFQRDRLHSECSRKWTLPERCKACHSNIRFSSDFIRHSLSGSHVKKLMDKGRTFTFEDDFLPLKELISACSVGDQRQ